MRLMVLVGVGHSGLGEALARRFGREGFGILPMPWPTPFGSSARKGRPSRPSSDGSGALGGIMQKGKSYATFG